MSQEQPPGGLGRDRTANVPRSSRAANATAVARCPFSVMLERSISMPMSRRGPKKRWMLAVIGWTMLGSVLIYLQYKLDYRVSGYGMLSTDVNTNTTFQQTIAAIAGTASAPTINDTGGGDDSVMLPYLPVDFLPLESSSSSSSDNVRRRFNESCAVFPTLFDLKINNIYWQHFMSGDGTNFYLYGAYFDNRSLTEGHPQVRILGMTDRIPPPKTVCHFWYANTSTPSFSSDATTYHYIWHPKRGNTVNGTLQPVLLNCPVPEGSPGRHSIPVVVSLVDRMCDNATNALKVVSNKEHARRRTSDGDNKKEPSSIAVCVKGLNYLEEDRSVRLVEWLELLRILGVHRVFMYELSVHQNMSRVLRHYQREGFVDVRPLTLPGDQLNEPRLRALYLAKRIIHKRQNELIPYNDCLYRNLGRYDYVALLDIDEVIVPMSPNATTWQKLIESGTPTSRKPLRPASLCAQHVYFFDHENASASTADYPSYLHMLTHVRRARNFTKPWQYVKCFHDTTQVLTLHNHFPMACGRRVPFKCHTVTMEVRHGRLHHYRKGCTIGLEDICAKNFMNDMVVDDTVLRYGDDLAVRSKAALKAIGLLT